MDNYRSAYSFRGSISQRPEDVIHVGIADMKIGKGPVYLKTVLGSCVGICLYSRRNRIGALAHAMLPRHHQIIQNKFKFADTAIEEMIIQLKNMNVSIHDLEAKLFGGAKIYFSDTSGVLPDIGKMNVEAAEEVLENLRISVVSRDVGGLMGRTIVFNIRNGNVVSKMFSGVEKIY